MYIFSKCWDVFFHFQDGSDDSVNVLLLLPTLNTYPVIRTCTPLHRYYIEEHNNILDC